MQPLDFYTTEVSKHKAKINKFATKSTTLSLFRVLSFTAIVYGIYAATTYKTELYIAFTSVFTVVFLAMVKLHKQNDKQKRFYKNLSDLNSYEIDALGGKLDNFATGLDFKDAKHPYTYDLDIFGKGSIFNLLNRTTCQQGEQALAKLLSHPSPVATDISNRQDATKELSQKIDFRQKLQAMGMSRNEGAFNTKLFEKRAHTLLAKKATALLYISPAIATALLAAAIIGFTSYTPFIIYWFLQISVVGAFLKKTNRLHSLTGRQSDMAKNFSEVLDLIENEKFEAIHLNELQQELKTGNKRASSIFKQLAQILNAFDNRLNMLFAIPMNGLVMWDLQCVLRYEKWHDKYANAAQTLIKTMGKFEALNSLGNFAFNSPEYTFPELSETTALSTTALGHPLIDKQKMVANDFAIATFGQTKLITGANMAGKSTFLRSVGVNLVLAMAGAPVCAKLFVFTPTKMYTSMRADDSLQENQSYFFAELKRLQSIMDALKQNENIFVITDEMLRGTNSNDKHKGSEGFILQLINYKVAGIVATHDILLGELSKKHPTKIENLRFEVEINDSGLHFDYKLKPGVSQNLNATYLMKEMGILPKVD